MATQPVAAQAGDRQIDYDMAVQDALRTVVRDVLADVASNGLPGEHHFYILFDTQASGVIIPASLREKFPEEMSIVLQHEFRDLVVDKTSFAVVVEFGGEPADMTIPFDAISVFVDPSADFALEFTAPPQG